MTNEEECLECKWCNVNRLSWWESIYHSVNIFGRLYIECCHPNIWWVNNGKKERPLCMCARADVEDTDTITRCGPNKKYFEPNSLKNNR